MPIRPKFTKEDIRRRFDHFAEVVERRELERLKYLGELCVTHARSVPADRGFHDRTGNLRSSIGYVIYKNGVAVMDNYAEVNGPEGGNAAEAIQKAKTVADRAARKHPTGFCLVVTAGMEYAVYVESKGHDVIASAEALARREMPKLMEELVSNIKKSVEP